MRVRGASLLCHHGLFDVGNLPFHLGDVVFDPGDVFGYRGEAALHCIEHRIERHRFGAGLLVFHIMTVYHVRSRCAAGDDAGRFGQLLLSAISSTK